MLYNYCTDRPGIFKRKAAYMDTYEYLADRIFKEKELRYRLIKEYCNRDTEFVIVFIKIRNKDIHKFVQCMAELDKKIAIISPTLYERYSSHCKAVYDMAEKECEKEIK